MCRDCCDRKRFGGIRKDPRYKNRKARELVVTMTLQQPSGKKIPVSAWRVVIILSSVATMVMYAETMLVPAIPDLINDFNISYSTSSWILTTYLITGAVRLYAISGDTVQEVFNLG
ncbi:MAG: hypothetical protein WAQ29_01080 [Nitrososphaeraceae archaeon]